MVKVSIIMPVLNGMPYFHKALESVLSQTLKDIEIIIVDAGSNDGTVEYVEDVCKVDERVSLLQSYKRSMGAQYNIGISHSTGEYIGFCENDDYCDACMFETLYDSALRYEHPDYIKCDFIDFSEKEDGMIELPIHTLVHHDEYYNKKITRFPFYELPFSDVNHWNGIYKADFIKRNNIVFNETDGAAGQDAGFVSQVLVSAKSRVYINDILYHYRQDNPNSSMKKRDRGKYWVQELNFMLSIFSRKDTADNVIFNCAVIDRLFMGFTADYAYDIKSGESNSYQSLVNELRNNLIFINNKYSNGLRCQSKINLFVNNPRLFDEVVYQERDYFENNRNKEISKVLSSKHVIIFGAGELGECMHSYLKNNDYDGTIDFCDNSKSGMYICGKEILSVEEAKKNEYAVFIITNSKYRYEMIGQLIENGINIDKISLIEGIVKHLSFMRYDGSR